MIVKERLKAPAHVWRAAFAGLLEDDFVDELRKVTLPTLLLWGTEDGFVPRPDQGALLAAMADAGLVVYERRSRAALGRADALCH